jgi:hypothetical protein
MRGFRSYDKNELFNQIDNLSIERIENQIITKYGGRVIKVANVSNRYEIFDIVKYLKDKINDIEKNFIITNYQLYIKGGQQYLKLISDSIEVGGVEFYKSFYILNSSDKSRRLSFNIGLYSETSKFYVVNSAKNIGLTKKHLKGVTEAAEEATVGLNDETFNEQIESLKSLVGHRISFSKLREVILGDNQDIPKINHLKFDAFKNSIRFASSDNLLTISREQRDMLFTSSDRLSEITRDKDFYLDAFWAFQVYLRLFNKQDSHIIKNETERIMKMTQWAVRNSVLESLGI